MSDTSEVILSMSRLLAKAVDKQIALEDRVRCLEQRLLPTHISIPSEWSPSSPMGTGDES